MYKITYKQREFDGVVDCGSRFWLQLLEVGDRLKA